MRQIFLTFCLLIVCLDAFSAGGDFEDQLKDAIAKKRGPFVVRIIQLMQRQTAAEAAVTSRYFTELSDADFHSAKLELANWALKERQPVLFTAVAAWARQAKNLSAKDAATLQANLVQCIAADPRIVTALVEGKGAANTSTAGASMVTTVKEGSAEVRTLNVALDPTSFALAEALFNAGALKGVTKVKYGGGPAVEVKEAAQFSWAGFTDWVLSNNRTELFPTLETYRKGLTSESSPTRLEVTEKMSAYGEKSVDGPPKLLREAIAKSLIRAEAPRYPATPRDKSLKTLTIDLRDGSDLKLARMLEKRGEAPGVEVINWNGVAEKDPRLDWQTVNYPSSNQVPSRDGMSLADQLDPSNFRQPDPKRPALWRTARLLKQSYVWTPCGGPTAAAAGVTP